MREDLAVHDVHGDGGGHGRLQWRALRPRVVIRGVSSRLGLFQGSRGLIPTGNPSPQEAVAMGRTVGTVSPWRRSPDLKDLILLHECLPEPLGQALVPIGEFVERALQERALRRLAHHHHRIGAIDGDDRDEPPLHSGFRAARQTLGVCQTLSPGELTPDGTASSVVDDGRHPIGP